MEEDRPVIEENIALPPVAATVTETPPITISEAVEARRVADLAAAIHAAQDAVAVQPPPADATYGTAAEAIAAHTAIPEEPDMPALPEGIPVAQPGEIIMNRQQLGRSRKPWLKDAKYRIYSQSLGGYSEGWWGPNMAGFFPDRDRAGVTTLTMVLNALGGEDGLWIYIEGDPDWKPPVVDPKVPKRRCQMVTLIGSTVVNLLRVTPRNETLRAKVMAAVGEMPAKELDTFEKLKDWVEFNFPRPKTEAQSSIVADLRVTFREIEGGTCRYSQLRDGVSRVKLTPEDIKSIMENMSDEVEFDDVMAEITSLIERKAEESCMDYRVQNDEIFERVADDTQTEDFDYSMSILKAAVRAHLKAVYPQEATDMGLVD
jgi:hypothetical protein